LLANPCWHIEVHLLDAQAIGLGFLPVAVVSGMLSRSGTPSIWMLFSAAIIKTRCTRIDEVCRAPDGCPACVLC